jgi:hypothetical protein
MKKTLNTIGIQLSELALLLLIPKQTLSSWFERRTSIPRAYSGYFLGINKYELENEDLDLDSVYKKWQTANRSNFDTQSSAALRKLDLDLRRNELVYLRLNQKKELQLRRLHFSEQYATYLSEDLQQNENLQDWCNLMRRSTAFDLRKLDPMIHKSKEIRAGLLAKINFWANEIN